MDDSNSLSEDLKETNNLLVIAQRDRELAAARAELSDLKRRRSLNLPVLIPVLVATIGATASIISVSVSQYYQAELASQAAAEEAELQRRAQQSAL